MEKTVTSRSASSRSVAADNPISVSFKIKNNKIVKKTLVGPFVGEEEKELRNVSVESFSQDHLARIWAVSNLRQKRAEEEDFEPEIKLALADFFCGAGGLTLGVTSALRSVGIGTQYKLACDRSEDSLKVYNANFSPESLLLENAENLIRHGKYSEVDGLRVPSVSEATLAPQLESSIGKIDVFVAGPPCEGNSNLNNKTRRTDDRNNHYVIAALIAAKLESKIVIIENVQTVKKAKQNVVAVAKALLASVGYIVQNSEYILSAEKFGTAQKRVRHFLIATKVTENPDPVDYSGLVHQPLSVMDAIGDLVTLNSTNFMNVPSDLSQENKKRIDYLFDNKVYELPDSQRPECHRDKEHTYFNVYSRMYPDKPSYTITTGFQSPGRGRFVHPELRRGLTPREGARLQGFPDYFKWRTPLCRVVKNSITRLIGDAVPPNLGEAAMLIALASCKKPI